MFKQKDSDGFWHCQRISYYQEEVARIEKLTQKVKGLPNDKVWLTLMIDDSDQYELFEALCNHNGSGYTIWRFAEYR